MSRSVQAVLVAIWLAGPLAVAAVAQRTAAQDEAESGIRFLDLAADTARQVVVDREPGQYLGHPTTVLLEDGQTIIAVYPKGHGRGAIVMKRSADGGLSWSERLPVPENWATSLETPTIHRVIEPATDRKRLIVFSGLYPIRMASSGDDGRTWTPLAPIGDYGGIVAMGSVERLADGRYAAWFHDDGRFFREDGTRTETMTLFQVESADGGMSWGQPRTLFAASGVHLCEPGVVRSPDGAELAMLLRENRRAKNSHVMFSGDEAGTWSEPRELPPSLTGDRHTAKYAPETGGCSSASATPRPAARRRATGSRGWAPTTTSARAARGSTASGSWTTTTPGTALTPGWRCCPMVHSSPRPTATGSRARSRSW